MNDSGELFLKIFNNLILRKLIFKFIKIENKLLYYNRYSFYDYPLAFLFKNYFTSDTEDYNREGERRKQFLSLKLHLYERFIIKNKQVVRNDFGIDTIYKYQIDFNQHWFKLFLKWDFLNIELYERVVTLFNREINTDTSFNRNEIHHEILLSDNIQLINCTLEKRYWYIDIGVIKKMLYNYEVNESKKLFKYLINNKKELLAQLIKMNSFLYTISEKDMLNSHYLLEYYNDIKSILKDTKSSMKNLNNSNYSLLNYINGYKTLDQIKKRYGSNISDKKFDGFLICDLLADNRVLNSFLDTISYPSYQHFKVLCKLSKTGTNCNKIAQFLFHKISSNRQQYKVLLFNLLALSINYEYEFLFIFIKSILPLLNQLTHNELKEVLLSIPKERAKRIKYFQSLPSIHLNQFKSFDLLKIPYYDHVKHLDLLPFFKLNELNSEDAGKRFYSYPLLNFSFKFIKKSLKYLESSQIEEAIITHLDSKVYQSAFYFLSLHHLSQVGVFKFMEKHHIYYKFFFESPNFGFVFFKHFFLSNFNLQRNLIGNLIHFCKNSKQHFYDQIALFKEYLISEYIPNTNNNNIKYNNNNYKYNYNIINQYKQLVSIFSVNMANCFLGEPIHYSNDKIINLDQLLYSYASLVNSHVDPHTSSLESLSFMLFLNSKLNKNVIDPESQVFTNKNIIDSKSQVFNLEFNIDLNGVLQNK